MKKQILVLLVAIASCSKSDDIDKSFHNSSLANAFLDTYDSIVWEVNESNTLGILGLMFSETPQKATLAMGSFDVDNRPVFDNCETLFFGESDFGEYANVIHGDVNSITLVSWDEERNFSSVKLIIHISGNTLTMTLESILGNDTIYMSRNDTIAASSFCN